jgi:hypothetical protein
VHTHRRRHHYLIVATEWFIDVVVAAFAGVTLALVLFLLTLWVLNLPLMQR